MTDTPILDFARGFTREKDEGTDPNWPTHTGTTTWVNGEYTVIEQRLGGLSARTRYTLIGPGGELGWFDTDIHRGEKTFLDWLADAAGFDAERNCFTYATKGEPDATDSAS